MEDLFLLKEPGEKKAKMSTKRLKLSDVSNITTALKDGWVITFPQGTTTPFKPIRRGTAHIIRQNKPIVIPIVIDGFRRSFDKKGLMIKKRGIFNLWSSKNQWILIMKMIPLKTSLKNCNMPLNNILHLLKVAKVEDYHKSEKELNKKREFWDMY